MRCISFSFLQPPGAKSPLNITSGQREYVTSSYTTSCLYLRRVCETRTRFLCKIEKIVDDRKRTYSQVTQKEEATEELKARRHGLT